MICLSAVIHKPIQTLHPVRILPGEQSPVTKLVVGREVINTRHPVYVMWTVGTYSPGQALDCNHFVTLLERDCSDGRPYTHADCRRQ